MKGSAAIRRAFFAGTIAVILPAFGCMEPTFESRRPDRAVEIDGTAPEWAGAEAYYNEADAYKLGFFNDDEYLYVYFATWNLSTQRIMMTNGFTIWFDGNGKKNKALGILYPRGRPPWQAESDSLMAGAAPGAPRAGRSRDEARGMPDRSSHQDPARLAATLNRLRSEAVIKSPAGDSILLCAAPDSAAPGIRAMLGARSRLLVIELRVPLERAGGAPYTIHAAPGDVIGVGFETGSMESPQRRRPEGMDDDGMPGEGMPPDGGMRPGGGMGPGGMQQGDLPKEIKLWTKVKLAP